MDFDTNSEENERIEAVLHQASRSLLEEGIKVCTRVLGEHIEKQTEYTNVCKSILSEKQYKKTQSDLDALSLQSQVKHMRTKKNKLRQLKENIQTLTVCNNNDSSSSSSSSIINNSNNNNNNSNNNSVIQVEKDGNCFFRCVAGELHGDVSKHKQVRAAVTDFMEEHAVSIVQLIDGSVTEHVQHMRLTDGGVRTWATEAELTATAQLYGVDLYIRQDSSGKMEWLRFPAHVNNTAEKYICLRLASEHFDIIRVNERPNVGETLLNAPESNARTSPARIVNTTESTAAPLKQPEVIVNMSSKTLSHAQQSLLSKGLKFVPARKSVDKGKLIADLRTWERRMRLREYFRDRDAEEDDADECRYKKESSWTPNAGRDKWLDAYIKAVKDDVISGLRKKVKLNMTQAENQAMRDLLNDDDIVIRPADKGSGIVIMDTIDYVEKLNEEMKNNTTYQKVENNNISTVQNKVNKVASNLCARGSISKNVKGYMTSSGGTSGKLQGNPKLHKTGVPLRTIVNGRNHPTEKMAEVVEKELRAHVTSLPSYIQDTTDFLNKLSTIQQPLPDGTLLFCLDVKALYPSVPRHEARAAVKEALSHRVNPQIPTEDVLHMMDTVLENNTFTFDGNHYIQTEGTAIGSHLGMNYASTYMGAWESELLKRAPKQPLAYFRYVDDVWGLWTHGLRALEEFHTLGNQIHPRIQLELRHASDKIEFLDVITSIREGRLSTDLYTKPTDKHLYLRRDSSHPESTKKAIPYGLGVRAKRICCEDASYQHHRSNIKSQLQQRGYDERLMEKELQKVDAKPREDLLTYRNKEHKNTRVPLVLTFSRALPNVGGILRKHLPTLYRSDEMKRVFPEVSMVAFRRDSNLQDILVHKKHNRQFFAQSNSSGPCGAKRCAVCPYVISADTFTSAEGITYKVRNQITCTSTNVVYALYCKRCKQYVYVGETGDTLYQRHLLNLSRIRTKHSDPVAQHFTTDGHDVSDFRIIGLEKLNGSAIYRKTMETLWKDKLRTYRPYGINVKE